MAILLSGSYCRQPDHVVESHGDGEGDGRARARHKLVFMNSQKQAAVILIGLVISALACTLSSVSVNERATVSVIASTAIPISPSPISTSAPFASAQTPGSQSTRPFPTPPPLPTKMPLLTPLPTFYATLYPYSLDSTEGWSIYTDTERHLAFPYPAAPPVGGYGQQNSSYSFSVQARWDSLNRWGVAHIGIIIYENPEHLSLGNFVAQLPWGLGPAGSDDRFLLPLAEALKKAGSDDAMAYRSQMGLAVCAALYKKWIYVFDQGFESDSVAQQKIFEILVRNVRFLP